MRDIGKVNHTLEILDHFELRAKKSFGQNFLVDINIIRNIVECAHIKENTCVVEIGPGIGGLTEYIARAAKKVIAYDIDERLMDVLSYSLSEYPNVEVRLQDFLTVDLHSLAEEVKDYEHLIIISNLPYYITSEILTKIMISPIKIDCFVGMMQKEVALKLTSKEKSPLRLLMDCVGEVNYEFTVTANVFIPKPNVDSAVISVTFKEMNKENLADFYHFLQACFKQRRKTIYNNLSQVAQDKDKLKDILKTCNIDPKLRAEQLSLDQFKELYDLI
ncbi:MAG: 16S rRNA (adenine(1518)-N(6)/adenine(1519)-N(6))-dimethyltransferase RsmA [Beduini sp.]|uniref:16S rRNA (adenine(1518)-N(6)/adenine(1519)-N(6))- dimethyltransferase RsmA n=1 Tax=Beduini sp. TaxID=1922300 RepID=UPI003990C165